MGSIENAQESSAEREVAQISQSAPVSRSFDGRGLVADRFEIEAELGAGGMGRVFAAFDRVLEAPVALKVLGELSTNSSVLLKREFRAASELVHPNLVRLHGLFVDGADWFFTMELVQGRTLPAFMKSSGKPPVDVIRGAFGQLASGLNALHRAGTLHGDLKPSNFLITDHDSRVVLLDFGLARPIGLARVQEFAGTPGYMAPEQGMDAPLTTAADWYAFGAVLYEALTGALPFRSPSERRLAGAPADLRELCLKLLSLRASDRPSGDEVMACFGVISEDKFADLPPPSHRTLIGRAEEMRKLQAAFESTLAGRPSVVLIHGPSGIGKTSLVQRFVQHARDRGALLLAGRCRERESMSYKAVDGLIDDIVSEWDALSEDDAAALLPHEITDLTVLFPALRNAKALADTANRRAETADQGLLRLRAIAAFRMLLVRLAHRAPLIVWIDDLQWGDAESALLLGPLIAGPEPVPLLFIASYRSVSTGKGPLLDALSEEGVIAPPGPTELALGPLPLEDAVRLALGLLPPEHPNAGAVAHKIGQDAGGHPLFIAELAHTAGVSNPSSDLMGPTTLLELVAKRVRALAPEVRGLLEAAAVAGGPLARSTLRQSQALSPSEAEKVIDILRANRLARSYGLMDDDAIDIHHDRIREIIVQGVSDSDRRRHHLNLAAVLEGLSDRKPDVLAAHYHGGGDLARAGRYWIVAGDEAYKALAFRLAADLYEKGVSHAEMTPTELRAVEIRRAEALAYAGKGPAAADAYLATAKTCPDDEAVELRRRAAEQLLLSGHIERGLEVIEQVLRATRMRMPRGGRLALASVVFGRTVVRVRGLRHVPRHPSDLSREEIARLDASWTIACSLALLDPVRGADFQCKHLLLALRAGEPHRLLRALTLEASYTATPGGGSERRTADLLNVADKLVKRSDDYGAISLLCLARGIASYLQGRIDTALTHCEEALRILNERCAGAVWETMSAQRFVIASLFFLGRLRRLSEFVPPLLADAEGTGNLYATMCFRSAYSTLAWLVADDVREARHQLERAAAEVKSSEFQLAHYNLLLGQTYLDLYTGDVERAHARIREQWSKLERAQLLRIGVIRVQLWQLRAACDSSAADVIEGRGQKAHARNLRRDARKLAARLRRDRITRAAPLAELVDAALDAAEGKRESAEGRLQRSIDDFEKLGLTLFAAAARVRLGELRGGALGKKLAESAQAAFDREGVVNLRGILSVLAPGFGSTAAS